MSKQKPQKLALYVALTEAELVARRKAQGEAQETLEKEEGDARVSSARHKRLVKTATVVFHELARVVSSGQELRDVEVQRGEGGILVRLDTGEVVKESSGGSAADRTLDLPLEDDLPLDTGADLGPEETGRTSLESRIVFSFRLGEWLTRAELAKTERMDGEIGDVPDALDALVARGDLIVSGKGRSARYRLADAADAEAAE